MLRSRARGVGSQPDRLEPAPDSPGAASTYQVRARMLAIGTDYWIEDAARRRTFVIDGPAMQARRMLVMRDSMGVERFRVPMRPTGLPDSFAIEHAGDVVARVVRSMTSPLREQFGVDLAAGGSWSVAGSIGDHEYEIDGPVGRVATVSRRWFHVADSYGVAIAPGEDDALVLAVGIVVDELVRR